MSVTSALNIALTGLKVANRRADIIANNVANAGTPGYVRRELSLSDMMTGDRSTGVTTNGVVRAENEVLSQERRLVSSELAQSTILSSSWNVLSQRIGDTVEGSGLFQSFSQFGTALENAAVTPESTASINSLYDAAGRIVDEFNILSDSINQQRVQADREIYQGVRDVNNTLKQISDFNSRLAAIDRTTDEAASIFDDRARALDKLSEYLPVQTIQREYGGIDILTKEGVYLLSGSQVQKLEFSPSPIFGPNETVDNDSLSNLTIGDAVLTPGSANYSAVSSGSLAALFQLRDQDLPEASAQLDAVAEDIITRFSDDLLDTTKTPGEQGLFVDTDPAGGPGLASRISLNPAIDPAQGGELWRLRSGIGAATQGLEGDGSLFKRMSDAMSTVRTVSSAGIIGSYSANELAAQFSSIAGEKRIGYQAALASTSSQHTALVEAEHQETGVNIDQQMQELMIVEQAYAANARVIEVSNQLLQRLMEL